MKLIRAKKSFKKEFKRQLKYAIIAAIGFIIAFSWREAIYNSINKIVVQVVESNGGRSVMNGMYTSITITILGVFFILLVSRFLRD